MSEAYTRALAWLYALGPRGIELGLARMRAALALRGDPHRAYPVVHVAGTNGKGSVSAMIERGLRAAGLRTGLYTSPHLHRFGERVRVDGAPVTDEAVVGGLEALRADPRLPPLSFFELATLFAFEALRDAAVDVAVIEVGLGGRLDATNVVAPIRTVITHVAMDHEAYLGPTIEAVAGEKAGILKAGVPAVTSSRGAARAVIESVAREVGAPLACIDRDFRVGGEPLLYQDACARIEGLRPALRGAHQRDNVACAVAAMRSLREAGLVLEDEAIRVGVADVSWPGRLEHVGDAPEVILDAAHNPDGCAALAAHVRALPRKKTVLLFGVMRDKNVREMLELLEQVGDERVYAAPEMTRAMPPEALAALAPGVVAPSLDDALEQAYRRAGPAGRVVVAGSIFVLAHVRARLLGLVSDPPIGL